MTITRSRHVPRHLAGVDEDPTPAGATPGLLLEDVWDRFADPVYTLACAIVGEGAPAEHVMRLGLAGLARSRGADAAHPHRTWSRLVYEHCNADDLGVDVPAQSTPARPVAARWLPHLPREHRVCLALCLFGGHTYREVAELVGLPDAEVAQLLTTSLGRAAGPAVDPAVDVTAAPA